MNEKDFTDIPGSVFARGFGMVPRLVMQDIRLTPEAKCIYAYLCSYSGCETQDFPDTETIIYHLGMEKEEFFKNIELLKVYGYVTVDQESGVESPRMIFTIEQYPYQRGDESLRH